MTIHSRVTITCDVLVLIDDLEQRCASYIVSPTAEAVTDAALEQGWHLREHFKTVPGIGKLYRDVCPDCRKRL